MKTSLKSADWTEEEMHELLDAWDPRLSMLCGASQREKNQNLEQYLFFE